ncbi:MAG: hypothetical protein EA413_03175 [Cyanobium sp. PLM2.Bin73]|nr:MAG: hypothetical protein EA413_03175 [Cyanobium sp. PLM2.Bin73]
MSMSPSMSMPLLLAAMALGLVLPSAEARAEPTETLYSLETRCSVAGGEPEPCVVEATKDAEGTTYRHTIGERVETVRISDAPVRMSVWDPSKNTWNPLNSAAARFSTNTICFNGRDLCVVNANYLNSVREERPDATAGRDLVQVRFDDSGRVDLTCYDDGCKEVR